MWGQPKKKDETGQMRLTGAARQEAKSWQGNNEKSNRGEKAEGFASSTGHY